MKKTIKGWHFTSDTLRGGAPIPPIGEWICHVGYVIPCRSGYHMSKHPFDALSHAPGARLHRVELRGSLERHNSDKFVGAERRILATMDATAMLRRFAKDQALLVSHYWNIPEEVSKYLTNTLGSREEVNLLLKRSISTTIPLSADSRALWAAYAATLESAPEAARKASLHAIASMYLRRIEQNIEYPASPDTMKELRREFKRRVKSLFR